MTQCSNWPHGKRQIRWTQWRSQSSCHTRASVMACRYVWNNDHRQIIVASSMKKPLLCHTLTSCIKAYGHARIRTHPQIETITHPHKHAPPTHTHTHTHRYNTHTQQTPLSCLSPSIPPSDTPTHTLTNIPHHLPTRLAARQGVGYNLLSLCMYLEAHLWTGMFQVDQNLSMLSAFLQHHHHNMSTLSLQFRTYISTSPLPP